MAPRNQLFTVEDDLALASAVSRRPILWDITKESYRRTDLKSQVWEEIATELGPKFRNQGPAVASHFKNLKDTFSQNMRKVRESTRSGAGTDSVYKPKWFLWEAMQFLHKTCAQAESTSNIVDSNCSQSSTAQVTLTPSIYFDETLQEYLMIPADSVVDSEQTLNCQSETSSISESTLPQLPSSGSAKSASPSPDFNVFMSPPSRPASAPAASLVMKEVQDTASTKCGQSSPSLYENKGSTKRKSNETLQEVVKVMKQVAEQPLLSHDEKAILFASAGPMTPSSRHAAFGTYVVSRLDSMDKETARKCENQIMQILFEFP